MAFYTQLLAGLLISINAFAQTDILQDYKSNPAKFYKTAPAKTTVDSVVEVPVVNSPVRAIETDALRAKVKAYKISQRKARLKAVYRNTGGASNFSGINGNDSYYLRNMIAPGVTEENLFNLSRMGLENGRAHEDIWSGSYWPYYQAGLNARYADPRFPRSSRNFNDYYNYLMTNRQITAQTINQASPAEKYDLLMNDNNWTLSQTVWQDTFSHVNQRTNEIETWVGICHGWAPAAFLYPRPTNAINVFLNSKNINMTLYPDDLKALTSYFLANVQLPSYMIGERCNITAPPANGGRPVNPECLDTNPGSWHILISNLLGRDNRSFVMDATYDLEVWNQPVVSYSVKYFNTATNRYANDLQGALVPRAGWRGDRFANFRNPGTVYVVGVAMSVIYSAENLAQAVSRDTVARDHQTKVDYLYDLELDGQGRIIGGEWYQQAHPDFAWKPVATANSLPKAPYQGQGYWDGTSEPPVNYQQVAPYNSRSRLPMDQVLDVLVNRARSN